MYALQSTTRRFLIQLSLIHIYLSRTGPEPCPAVCPVCGGPTEIRKTTDVESLYCINPDCLAKRTKSLALFVSRDAMNMDGLSEATLEKFIGAGFLHDFSDLFRLSEHQEEIEMCIRDRDSTGSERS